DKLKYNVAGDDADGQYVGEDVDPEADLHAHEADTVNFEGDGDFEDITNDVITEDVDEKKDVFAGIDEDESVQAGKKAAEPVKAAAPVADDPGLDAEEEAILFAGEPGGSENIA
ncbi:MAG TPA: hypothetical protein DD435_15175, partial [Cyanobacteria bacterium UBA8530]|nr:hypothetical protein [Cyanobacteria bacterium UBA8530]